MTTRPHTFAFSTVRLPFFRLCRSLIMQHSLLQASIFAGIFISLLATVAIAQDGYHNTEPYNPLAMPGQDRPDDADAQDDGDGFSCYSLPYGGLGFLSHVWTYYCVAMIYVFRRSPVIGKKIDEDANDRDWWYWLGVGAGGVQLTTTVVATVFNMVNCREQWW